MILQNIITAIVFYVAWLRGVSGTSYSQVYVSSGPNGPYQYVRYGAPAAAYGAPLAQLSAAPVGSVLPLRQDARFVPCIAPCVPTQAVVPVARADLVASQPPSAVVANDPPSPYQYSYMVFDDSTGDQKAQNELSDGAVVRGQYSFLQPDGYVRRVQYTADDATGFNAVVNYVPGAGDKPIDTKSTMPRDDSKSEALKAPTKSEKMKNAPKDEPTKSDFISKGEVEIVTEKAKEIPASKVPEIVELASPSETASQDVSVKPLVVSEKVPKSEAAPDSGDRKAEVPAAAPGDKVVKEQKPVAPAANLPVTVDQIPPPQQAAQVFVPNAPPLGYISYDQLLKCIQKLKNSDLRANSPLTYILLPSKPC